MVPLIFILKISKRLAFGSPINKRNLLYDIFRFENYRFKHLSTICAIGVIAIPSSFGITETFGIVTEIGDNRKFKSNRFQLPIY